MAGYSKTKTIRNKAPITRAGVFQSLMVAGIEKEILEARKLINDKAIDKVKATDFIIAQSSYAGLLEVEKEKLGDERFFKLFVAPVLVDHEFGNYYMAKEPNRAVAGEALKAAQTGGLQAAAEKAGSQVKRAPIPVTTETAALAAEAKKSIGTILTRWVEDGGGYAIIQPVEVTDTQITADVVYIPKTPVAEFILAELAAAKVPVTDRFYSWFKVADLKASGGVLASTQKESKNTGEK